VAGACNKEEEAPLIILEGKSNARLVAFRREVRNTTEYSISPLVYLR
jgi:hypothetical protein